MQRSEESAFSKKVKHFDIETLTEDGVLRLFWSLGIGIHYNPCING